MADFDFDSSLYGSFGSLESVSTEKDKVDTGKDGLSAAPGAVEEIESAQQTEQSIAEEDTAVYSDAVW
jgi:hypothetical protein